jgi:hypothetical protein
MGTSVTLHLQDTYKTFERHLIDWVEDYSHGLLLERMESSNMEEQPRREVHCGLVKRVSESKYV